MSEYERGKREGIDRCIAWIRDGALNGFQSGWHEKIARRHAWEEVADQLEEAMSPKLHKDAKWACKSCGSEVEELRSERAEDYFFARGMCTGCGEEQMVRLVGKPRAKL